MGGGRWNIFERLDPGNRWIHIDRIEEEVAVVAGGSVAEVERAMTGTTAAE